MFISLGTSMLTEMRFIIMTSSDFYAPFVGATTPDLSEITPPVYGGVLLVKTIRLLLRNNFSNEY